MERSGIFIFAAVIVSLTTSIAFIAAHVAHGVVVVGVPPFTFFLVVVIDIVTVIVLITIESILNFIALVFSALLRPRRRIAAFTSTGILKHKGRKCRG